MYRRICILVLTVLAAVSVCFARTAGPGMRGPEITSPNINSPDGFKPDSLNTATSERNQRLYDSIQSKTNRRAVPRMLYRMLFVKPVLDTTFSGRVLDESRLLEPYAGKTVGDITIERRHPFDSDGNWLERTGNKIHMLTRDRVIRRDLLFKPGDKIDPQLIVRNKQLLRWIRHASIWSYAPVTAGRSASTAPSTARAARWSDCRTPTFSAGATP